MNYKMKDRRQKLGGHGAGEDNYPEYPHVSKIVLLFFCSYVITWYLQLGSRISGLGAIRIELILACLLTPLAFAIHGKSKARIESPLLSLSVVYFLLLAVMTVFSYDFHRSWDIFFNRVIKFAFMAFFIICFVKSPKGMRFFIAAFMLACMKMGHEGVVGQLTGSLVWQNQGVMRLHGSTLMYHHPNSFSGMALGTLPFILYLFPIVNRWVKALLFVQFVFAINIILHTASRTGYVGLIGIILVAVFRSKHKVKMLLFSLVALMLVALFAPEQYLNRFRSIYVSSSVENNSNDPSSGALHGGDSSKAKRIQILKDSIDIFISHPIGVGVSAFPSIRRDTFGRYQDTHNLYLEIATNLGIQGIIIFAYLIYYLFSTLLKCRKRLLTDIIRLNSIDLISLDGAMLQKASSHYNEIRFLKAICDSVILFISLRLFLGLFGMDLYEIYWWFFLGITLSILSMQETFQRRTDYFFHSTD